MILNTVSSANVCVRCQLRLSIYSLPSASLLPVKSRSRRGAREQHDGSRPEKPNASQGQADSASPWQLRRVKSESRLPDAPKAWRPMSPHLSARPLGRLHGVPGDQKRERGVDLNMEALGSPAEVIVLKDAGIKFGSPTIIEEVRAEEKVDILARLNAERGLIRQAEVEKNIKELKPKSSLVAWKELQKLQRELVEGFTTTQLKKYAESLESRRGLETRQIKSKLIKNVVPRPVFRRTRWVTGVSATGGDFMADSLRGYDSEAFTDKQRLVMRILREYWQLEAIEFAESAGEVELEIGSVEFDLLNRGRVSLLRELNDKLIATREEKIEVFRSRSVIRITAAKEKAEFIAQNIEDVLRQLETDNIKLGFLGHWKDILKGKGMNLHNDLDDDSVVNELAQITETHIRQLYNEQLAVFSIDLKKRDAYLSSRIDVVRRLLLTSSNLADRTKVQLGCHHDLKSLVAMKYHMKDGMNWRNRIRNWARWTSPYAKPVESIKATSPSAENRAQMNGLDAVIVGNPFKSTEGDVAMSMTMPQSDTTRLKSTSTSAVIGHVLHEVPDGVEVAADPMNYSVSQRTVFQPASMNLSRVLGSRQMDGPSTTELVMRFLPSPWTFSAGPNALAEFPPVEIRFEIDRETKFPSLKEVTALVDSTASDVMLPNAPLDLRFQQRIMVQLYTSHKTTPQVDDFLNMSQLNMTRGRIETPPGLTLPVPGWLCQVEDLEDSRTSQDESFDVEYLFAGLEYRTCLALEFEGWRLLYTSIEGGKADGRRGELSLMPWRIDNATNMTEHMPLASQEKHAQEFVNAAYRLVHTLENSSVPMMQSTKPPSSINRTGSGKGRLSDDFTYFRRKIDLMQGSRGDAEDGQVG